MLKRNEICLRDPFVLPVGDTYYLTGTDLKDRSVRLYAGHDLEVFDEPTIIFTIGEDSWAKSQLWAPEIHLYNGKYYLFVTILGKNGLRGVQIAVCDTPDGTYVPVVNHPATPQSQSCIDGTLYIENGKPYIVYSHDWPDCPVAGTDYYEGEICAVELSADLCEEVSEPFVLWKGKEPSYAAINYCPMEDGKIYPRYGTDAPFFHRLQDGTLLCMWSPMVGDRYVVALVKSESGTLHGPWTHQPDMLFEEHGGHAMLFYRFEGQLTMCLHQPDTRYSERTVLVPLIETKGTLIKQETATNF